MLKKAFVVLILGLAVFQFIKLHNNSRKSTPENPVKQLPVPTVPYRIIANVDGDTVKAVNLRSGEVKYVRFMGVDTPETVKYHTPVGCYGIAASNYTKSLLPRGRVVGMEYAININTGRALDDKYLRTLAYVWIPEAYSPTGRRILLQELLLKKGFAHEYSYKHYGYKYQSKFKAWESFARVHRIGLWGKCPWGIT